MGVFSLLLQVQLKNGSAGESSPPSLRCPVLGARGWDHCCEPNRARIHLHLISFGRDPSEETKTTADELRLLLSEQGAAPG